MHNLIEINDLNINLNNRVILQNINLSIKEQAIVTIIGPNGAGKSTLIKAILGLIKPTSGNIIKASKLKIGYLPQNIFFPSQIPINVLNFLQLNNPIDLDLKVHKDLGLNIEHLYHKSIHSLSGGELQRVLLMRALLKKPNLLILDEPTKSIDLNGQIEFYKLCSSLRTKTDCAILMASHDLHFVMSEVNSVICLNQHICCQGLPKAISQDQAFIKMFGATLEQLSFYHHYHNHYHQP